MSIDLLHELNQEVRRLFVAGGKLAQGDLRLSKLQPSLQKLGEASPVFARVAKAVEQTIDRSEENPAGRLLELATLLNSILYTQGQTETKGQINALPGAADFKTYPIPYRKLGPVIEALTVKGQGRLEVIRAAYEEGLFRDYRLLLPAVAALDETYAEIPELLEFYVIPSYGADALPVLRNTFSLEGGKGDSRRLRLIQRVDRAHALTLILEAAGAGSIEVKSTAIELLGDYPEQETFLLEQADERRKELRRAALLALSRIGTPGASDRVYKALVSKDRELAIQPIQQSQEESLIAKVIGYAASVFDTIKQGNADNDAADRLYVTLEALRGRHTEGMFELLRALLSDKAFIRIEHAYIHRTAAWMLSELPDSEAQQFAISLKDMHKDKFLDVSFRAALYHLPPAEVYDLYAPYFAKGTKNTKQTLLRELYEAIPNLYDRMSQEQAEPSTVPVLDTRWIRIFMDEEAHKLVFSIVQTPDEGTVNYLKDFCTRQGIGYYEHEQERIQALLALFRIGYEEAAELALSFVLGSAVSGYYYPQDQLRFLMKQLPASYADRLEQIIQNSELAEKQFELLRDTAAFLRSKSSTRENQEVASNG